MFIQKNGLWHDIRDMRHRQGLILPGASSAWECTCPMPSYQTCTWIQHFFFFLTAFLASRPCYSQKPALTVLLAHKYTMFGLQVVVRSCYRSVLQTSHYFCGQSLKQQRRKICLLSGTICYLFSKRAASQPSHNLAGLRS